MMKPLRSKRAAPLTLLALIILGNIVELSVSAEANTPGGDSGTESQWVHYNSSGKLVYQTTEKGDRIMDFSSAGYMGGGVSIPLVPAKVTIGPSGGDDAAAIQNAIDEVEKLEPVNGFRGAVQLGKGTYSCSRPLNINASGVVLRGSGFGTDGTVLNMVDKPHVCIVLGGSGSGEARETGTPTSMTDSYVPSGATLFQVADASALKAGDTVLIRRPVTKAWVEFMGMDKLVRGGQPQTWIPVSSQITTERVITAVSGNRITLDIPLTDSFDAQYLTPPGGSVVKCAPGDRISQVGVENLRIVSPPQKVGITEPQYQALKMNNLVDAWARDIDIEDTVNSVSIGKFARRVTMAKVSINHTVATSGAAKPADFGCDGSQILYHHCSCTGNNVFYFATGAEPAGPTVLLDCEFRGDGHIQPHARWATGLLVDECRVPESGIDFMNRGTMGSGHGWTVGWAVAWNCVAKSYLIQQPPSAMNWAIGCIGKPETDAMPGGKGKLPMGTFDSQDHPVTPQSLYLAQLRERLGPQALRNIGY